jgi:2-methylisocitrate lyase-like PEP mutase family enzyme
MTADWIQNRRLGSAILRSRESATSSSAHWRFTSLDQRQIFRDLHKTPFILPNPWDLGSAKILASMHFSALATTSHGFANSLGRADGDVTREEAIAHARLLADATSLPINGDLENGFGEDPEDVVETIEQALTAGLAGCSIEDFGDGSIYSRELAIERVRAAAEANSQSDSPLVLTARAENFIRGNPDLKDTIGRLQAYQEAGADVLYAPGLMAIDDIQSLIAAVDRPVNVLLMPGGPAIPELFRVGAIRVSTGSSISMAAQSAIVEAARELLGAGTQTFWTNALSNASLIKDAISTKT